MVPGLANVGRDATACIVPREAESGSPCLDLLVVRLWSGAHGGGTADAIGGQTGLAEDGTRQRKTEPLLQNTE